MSLELILDSSNNLLVIGLVKDNSIIYKYQKSVFKQQSELIIQELSTIIESSGYTLRNLTKVIVTIGPGSFTGVRIALTVAKTLAITLNIPIVPLSSLAAYCGIKNKSIALFDAKSDRAYIGIYHLGRAEMLDTVLLIDDIKKIVDQRLDYQIVAGIELLNIYQEVPIVDIVQNMFELAAITEPASEAHNLAPNYLK